MTKFNLTLDINAAYKWTVVDGIRDLIQNMLDQGNYDWDYTAGKLTLTNYGVSLSKGYFLQGKSTKRNDPNSRGQYGEGSSLSVAVLLREGCEIVIENNNVLWSPSVEWDENFESDVIVIQEEELSTPTNNFSIEIDGISDDVWEEVLLNTLPFQEDLGETFSSEDCTLLLDDKFVGRIYCGGLFVCEMSDISAGYDFKPHALPLNRDRKEVSTWDLCYRSKDLWKDYIDHQIESEETSLVEDIVEKLADNSSKELTYLRYNTNHNEDFLDKVYDIYEDRYEGKMLVTDYREKESAERKGIKAEVAPEPFVEVLRKSSKYQEIDFREQEKDLSLEEMLEDFGDKWYDSMCLEMDEDWKALKERIMNEL